MIYYLKNSLGITYLYSFNKLKKKRNNFLTKDFILISKKEYFSLINNGNNILQNYMNFTERTAHIIDNYYSFPPSPILNDISLFSNFLEQKDTLYEKHVY